MAELSFFLILFVAQAAFSATIIDNIAEAAYSVSSSSKSTDSNKVTTLVCTQSKLEYLKYAPLSPNAELVKVPATSYLDSTGTYNSLPAPTPVGSASPLDISNPIPLITVNVYHAGEPFFLRLSDDDQNIDPSISETISLTLEHEGNGEKETLLLSETGPNTGVFVGYIQSTTENSLKWNGRLSVHSDSKITATYLDKCGLAETGTEMVVESTALVDPFGVVFDSSTGLPVDGAIVTLMDTVSGAPAIVYGDDGVSKYPSSITTGGTASDSSGVVYTFSPGQYRFPFVQPGRYRLVVTPPASYKWPSTVPNEELYSLPNGPFAIEIGSKGEEFVVNPGPALHIDIPADPPHTLLWVAKTASKQSVSIGDFLQYKVTVENTSEVNVDNVMVSDRLPLGFRYRKGSTKINGFASVDPSISSDGRTIVFGIGTLIAGIKADITYVVEVAAGAKLGKGINTASATGSGNAVSNTARAEVLVKEDLFESKTIIMGRVFPRGCGESQDVDGVSGVRIYLEDGTYVVTDKNGMYHFEGLKPGTHVVQLDLTTVPEGYELLSCEENSRFAGTPYSQFVDLQGGTMWRADFYLAPKPKMEGPKVPEIKEPEFIEIKGEISIELNSVLKTPESSAGSSESGVQSETRYAKSEIQYEIPIHVAEAPLKNLRLSVILPEGVTYTKGSSRLGDKPIPDPEVMENILTYRLGDAESDWKDIVKFNAEVPLEGSEGEFATKAILTFDTEGTKNKRTPVVENILARIRKDEKLTIPPIILHPHFESGSAVLSSGDKVQLDQVVSRLKGYNIGSMSVTGHTDSQRIGRQLRKTYADNYELSHARARSVAEYLNASLKLDPSQVITDGKGPDEPVAGNDNSKGMAQNRRVELRVTAEKGNTLYDLKNAKDRSGVRTVEIDERIEIKKTEDEKILTSQPLNLPTSVRSGTMPEIDDVLLNSIETGLGWIWPYEGYYPSIPSTKVAVKHDPAKMIKLLLNGEDVDPVYFEGTKKRSDNHVAVSLWIGIHLKDGGNQLEAAEYDKDGSEIGRIRQVIHYSGHPVKAELVPEKSRLTADGKAPSVIAVRLTDKDGHPVREGVGGEYKINPPYMSLQKLEDLQKDPLTMSKSEWLKYTVSEDGVALIELQPTSKTGEAVLRFNLVNGENEVRAWLTPGERDWILVGLAEGTAGYNTVSGNMESVGDSDVDDKYYEDGRLAFFAKGMIKGKWLLTMAYDSEKKGIKRNDSLHGIIDPDQYYTLYGDATQQGYEAASARSLYLKIERDRFYALFGDFDTGLTVTELSRYSRNLNGFKSEMKGEKFDFNVFVSDTNQAFIKDEIRGDGTSGLYMLSKKNIVLNSESITIETRDRFRSEVIISSQKLSRHIDYNIDYDAGTIYFKSPVHSKDENFNPIYIVVDYESFDPSDMSYNYGGRGAVRMLENRVEVGATHIHEGRTGGDGNLTGIDAKLKVDDKTEIRAEYSSTDTDFNGVDSKGSAYLAELSHRSEKLDGKVYVREQESEFGLGQQNGSESGTRKLGFDGTYRLDEKVSLTSDVFRQYNLGTDAERDMAQVQARYNEKQYELHGGLRHAEDRFDNGEVSSSEQMIAGGSYRLWNDHLVFRLDHEQSLFSNNENADYPTRTILGVDYKLSDTASLFIAQEFTQGENEDTQTTRIGMKASPWNGGQISSSLEQQYTENGARVFAVNGIKQTWQVTKKWSMDAGLDRSETLKHPGNDSFNTNVPAASGGTDFTAVSLGVAFKEEKWGWTGRVEKRDSEDENKIGLFTGAYGEVQEGLGLAAALQAFRTESSSGADSTSGNLRFSLAYRPNETKWIVLDRLDYLFDKQEGGDFDYDNWRIINNLNANWKRDRKTQISVQYGAKYVNETIDDSDYSGYTDLMGLEGRYDITKKWDIGLRGNILHSWDAEQYKYGYGPSVGFNIAKNIWLSLGYNIEGFRDRDFSRADFTSEGPYVKFRMKFDQGTAKDAVKWFSGQ